MMGVSVILTTVIVFQVRKYIKTSNLTLRSRALCVHEVREQNVSGVLRVA